MSDAEPAETPPSSADGTPETATPSPDTEEWPTHGGYLGCLVATIFGCLFSGFLGSELVSFVHFTTRGPAAIFITSAVIVMIAGIIVFGWIGWQLGKRLYREYPAGERRRRKASSSDETPAQIPS